MLALDHRIIGGIICGSIILLSTIAICIKYIKNNKKITRISQSNLAFLMQKNIFLPFLR